MKKTLLAFLSTIVLFSCKKDSGSSSTSATIIGKWTGVYQIKVGTNPPSRDSLVLIPGAYVVNFIADGTILGSSQTYKINGNTLIWVKSTFPSMIDTFQITTLTDTKLTLYKRRASNLETWDNYSR